MKKSIIKTTVIADKGRRIAPSVIATSQSVPTETEQVVLQKKLRVAAYCRVSTLEEEQDLSYETQCSYYEETIKANPDMELVGVYGDHGSSGLRMSERTEFQRLLADCKAGKIDAVYTKSVSRLARNAIDCQKVLEMLHELGVYVFFEKEGIKSSDLQFTLVLKLLASLAQEQSNGQSQTIKWVVDNNAAMGRPAYKCCYGYRKAYEVSDDELPKSERHNWVIHEEEAKKVRLMFDMITDGFTSYEVAKRLTELEKEQGNSFVWKSCKVCGMLKNIAYKGDIQTHKTVVMDYLDGKAVPNDGYRDSFYLSHHHEPIISEEQFDKVQQIMAERGRKWKEARAC